MIEHLKELVARVREFISDSDARGDEGRFTELALEIFAFQFRFNRPYWSFCEAQGVRPGGIRSYAEIPGLLTSAFKDFDLTVLPEEERTTVFHSSGTTEQRPSRHYHSRDSLDLYEHALGAGFGPMLLTGAERPRFLLLTPPPSEAPNSSLVHMFDTVARRFGGGEGTFAATASPEHGWVLREEMVEEFVERSKSAGDVVVICGTAFSFVHLCDYLREKGRQMRFPAGSRVLETGGYKGRSRSVPKEELHGMIGRSLNIQQTNIVSEYGMSELSSQAYDGRAGDERRRHFRFPHWARAQVISPETGKPVDVGGAGLMRIYDLANVASVMAVQTEDLAIRHEDGFELVGRATQSEARGCSLLNVNG